MKRAESIQHLGNVSKTGSRSYDLSNSTNLGKNQKPFILAIDEYKRLCSKGYQQANNNFITALKQEVLTLSIDMFSAKEINTATKIIGSYYYFKHIILNGGTNETDVKNSNKSIVNIL